MAKPQKKKVVKKTESTPIISVEKKIKILGLFLCVLGVFIFLSIISYSKFDLANLTVGFSDFQKIFSNEPEFLKRAGSTRNWLGIFGAYTSNFFINSTIGYFSIVFPVLIFTWGYFIIKKDSFKISVFLSNFIISSAVIISTFFGVLISDYKLLETHPEISGKIGLLFGSGMSLLLGGVGSIILLFTIQFVIIFIAFDIKFGRVYEFIQLTLAEVFTKKEKSEKETEETKPEPVLISDEVDKKEEKEEEKPVEKETIPEILNEEEVKETKIRIINKDEEIDVVEKDDEPKPEENEEKVDDTQQSEVDVLIEKELPDQWEEKIEYSSPQIELLEDYKDVTVSVSDEELKRNAGLLKEKLALFDIHIDKISVTPGPVVTLYELVPAPGVKISRIVSLENDIALALAARGIRIIAPIPGKSAIGVEIPNAEAEIVSAKSVINKLKTSKADLPLALGKTISGETYITDLAKMPHLLIAGATGAGKSVGINMMITSLIYAKHPSDIKFVIIDPKKIELSFYRSLNKHFLAVSPDLDEEIITNPQNALLVLKAVEYEMEKRYDKLAKVGVRNIVDYNKKIENPKSKPKDTDKMQHFKMPYIIVIIDELADLMITSGKEVEEPIARLAQLARAVGIHLIVATQRPSVNVITGTIKANFSARIAYQVATKIDSRTILDMKGAEQLLGRGDMLFLPGGSPKPIRIQNAYISTDEVERLTNYIYTQKGYAKRFLLPSMFEKKESAQGDFLADLDPMFEDAARVIVRHQQGSVSLLQRRLKLGYSRAARIVDQLEEAGVVGPSEGSKAREVIVETEEELETILRSL
ncbi:MAG: DNA translocase FtsK 4TM domain-containing protein [Ignavibacteria bacterium]|jgi:S-DNA-T family DNA segregation ATPase FtsK/SpoIIIE